MLYKQRVAKQPPAAAHRASVAADATGRWCAPCLQPRVRALLVVGRWNVSLATTTESLFAQSALFNSSLADWDTARVLNMGDTYVARPLGSLRDPRARRVAKRACCFGAGAP